MSQVQMQAQKGAPTQIIKNTVRRNRINKELLKCGNSLLTKFLTSDIGEDKWDLQYEAQQSTDASSDCDRLKAAVTVYFPEDYPFKGPRVIVTSQTMAINHMVSRTDNEYQSKHLGVNYSAAVTICTILEQLLENFKTAKPLPFRIITESRAGKVKKVDLDLHLAASVTPALAMQIPGSQGQLRQTSLIYRPIHGTPILIKKNQASVCGGLVPEETAYTDSSKLTSLAATNRSTVLTGFRPIMTQKLPLNQESAGLSNSAPIFQTTQIPAQQYMDPQHVLAQSWPRCQTDCIKIKAEDDDNGMQIEQEDSAKFDDRESREVSQSYQGMASGEIVIDRYEAIKTPPRRKRTRRERKYPQTQYNRSNFETKNLNRHFRSKIREVLRDMHINKEGDPAKVETVLKYLKPNRVGFKEMQNVLAIDWLREQIKKQMKSGEFLRKILTSVMSLESKMLMIKYYSVMEKAVQSPFDFIRWKF